MSGDFFSGVEQVDVSMGDVKAKLPLFYRKARAFSAVFPAKLWKVRKAVPDRRFVPAQIAPGVAAIQLGAFEYYDVDIPPYNEFAMCIPLNSAHFLQIPGYNLLRQMIRMEYDTYFHHLPVTTEVALRGGVDYYGFPKFLASIDFSDTEEWVDCELKEGEELICGFRGRKVNTPRSGIIKFFCHLYQDRLPQTAEGKMNAQSYALSFNPSHAELFLGSSHPIARELSELLISTKPLMYLYVPDLQLILYGPENLSFPLLRASLKAMGISPEGLKGEKELASARK
jgi:hypothetical protein